MTEHIAQFGHDRQLIGIVNCPPTLRDDTPACLLFNSGVMHRIGPHRLNVKLARALAEIGMPSLRFDLSGIGDSGASSVSQHSSDQALDDLQAAMEHLTATLGSRRFVVFGLCSGARHAMRIAVKDERVVGLMMFDGITFSTFRSKLNRRLARLQDLSWTELMKKPWQWAFGPPLRRPSITADPTDPAELSKPAFVEAMDTLADRGTDVYAVVSGSFLESFNYAGQWRDSFRGARFLDHARLEYRPQLDHTLTPLAGQRALIALVVDWLRGRHAAVAAAPALGMESRRPAMVSSLHP